MSSHLYPCCRGVGCEVCEGLEVEPQGTYLIVKHLPLGLHIGLSPMIFNWRVTRGDGSGFDRGWCYFGRGRTAFIKAVESARSWDGEDESEPPGWNKRVIGPPGTRQEIRETPATGA